MNLFDLLRKHIQKLERKFLKLQFGAEKRILLYRELSALMHAGYSKGEAVDIIWKLHRTESGGKRSEFLKIYEDIRKGLHNGLSFSKSFQKWIPNLEYLMLLAMEESEDLATNLEGFCEFLKSTKDQSISVFENLGYPFMLLSLSYGMLVYFSTIIAKELDRIIPIENWEGLAGFLYDFGVFLGDAIPYTLLMLFIFPLLSKISLVYWIGKGRILFDGVPIFTEYRLLVGSVFLQSLSCFLSSGLTVMEALQRMIPTANPYLQSRLKTARYYMLNGDEFGRALRREGMNWPDGRVALSLSIFAQVNDYSSHLKRIANSMMEKRKERLQKMFLVYKVIAFITVFGVISSIIWTMYNIQSLITVAL